MTPKKVRTSDHDKKKILEAYRQGKTVLQISKLTGVKRPTCHDIIKRHLASMGTSMDKNAQQRHPMSAYKNYWGRNFDSNSFLEEQYGSLNPLDFLKRMTPKITDIFHAGSGPSTNHPTTQQSSSDQNEIIIKTEIE